MNEREIYFPAKEKLSKQTNKKQKKKKQQILRKTEKDEKFPPCFSCGAALFCPGFLPRT